ncbi:MAG: Uma2 family endonuclease [Bacteroidota bacterium]|nr:Uma2 family endonuclease [Bacteroidota bacterium]
MSEKITSLSQLDLNKQYTYADYLNWWFDERVELIKGFIKKMSHDPNNIHQRVSANLSIEIGRFLKKQKCQLRFAPFDVRLTRKLNDREVTTVVQPDICIICNPELLDEKGCNDAPDMIIEILSESNRKHDLVTKFQLYEEAGVSEYWIAYPLDCMIEVYLLKNGKYYLDKKYIEDDIAPVFTIPGLKIDLKDIF